MPNKAFLEDTNNEGAVMMFQKQYRDREQDYYKKLREQGLVDENFK